MTGGIFLIQDDGELVEMNEQAYDSEDLLQELLAKYPNLLAGDQINSVEPRRWLLVTREMSVPGEPDGGGRWSLDHLFLDQDAIPTLVEVKRSSDTRIRREVLGQMLDYAANGVAYWSLDTMRSAFESNWVKGGADATGELQDFLGAEADVDEFWQKAKTNLQAGRIRMVFVADEIPEELRRIIEFLNEQMDPAEVLAVEIKQFIGQGMKTLVPKVIGQTAAAKGRKIRATRPERQWDEESFFEELNQAADKSSMAVARRLLDWAKERQLRIWWGKGQQIGSFFPLYDNDNGKNFLFAVWTSGNVEIQFQHMNNRPFDDIGNRLELATRLSGIEGVQLGEDVLSRRPSIQFTDLAKDDGVTQFLNTFDWVLQEIKACEAPR